MGSQYPSHYLGTWYIQHYYRWCAHTSAASSRLNWRPCWFKWTRPFRRKTKSGFCACAITFQTQSTYSYTVHGSVLSPSGTDWIAATFYPVSGEVNTFFPTHRNYVMTILQSRKVCLSHTGQLSDTVFLYFRLFVLFVFANSRDHLKNESTPPDSAWIWASKLFDNADRRSSQAALCSRSWSGVGSRCHYSASGTKRETRKIY